MSRRAWNFSAFSFLDADPFDFAQDRFSQINADLAGKPFDYTQGRPFVSFHSTPCGRSIRLRSLRQAQGRHGKQGGQRVEFVKKWLEKLGEGDIIKKGAKVQSCRVEEPLGGSVLMDSGQEMRGMEEPVLRKGNYG